MKQTKSKDKLAALSLFFLAPFLSEFLLGATTVSRWQGILPVIMLYGGGILLIREVSVRLGGQIATILLLGLVYGLIEEGILFQTLYHPNILGVDKIGGRYFGVNWLFALWAIGYHAVWSSAVPILLAGRLFPSIRNQSWLSNRGLIVPTVFFLLGSFAIGHFIRTNYISGFQTPAIYLMAEGCIIALLLVAVIRKKSVQFQITGKVAEYGTTSITVFAIVLSCFWFALLHLPNFLKEGFWVIVVLTVWSSIGFFAIRKICSLLSNDKNQSLSIFIIFGAILISSLHGFVFETANNHIDHVAQGFGGVIALVALIILANKKT